MEKKPLVLLIDDEKDLVEMLAYQFKARGYDAVTAGNGFEGLEKLKEIRPDLIVLDLNMPKMGGVDFYQKICGDGGKPAYPVLVLTARANMEQLFKDLDVDGFMSKPFEVDELIHEVELIIQKKARSVQTVKRQRKKVLHSVYVVDSDPEAADKIALGLLKAGYKVACAASAGSGLELLMLDPPALALVKLALPDMSGDVMALKALRIAKIADVKFLLYEKRDLRHLQAVRDQIGDKSGIIELIEYDTTDEIVHAVDSAIQKGMVEASESEG